LEAEPALLLPLPLPLRWLPLLVLLLLLLLLLPLLLLLLHFGSRPALRTGQQQVHCAGERGLLARLRCPGRVTRVALNRHVAVVVRHVRRLTVLLDHDLAQPRRAEGLEHRRDVLDLGRVHASVEHAQHVCRVLVLGVVVVVGVGVVVVVVGGVVVPHRSMQRLHLGMHCLHALQQMTAALDCAGAAVLQEALEISLELHAPPNMVG
jgi:hypothetical protein